MHEKKGAEQARWMYQFTLVVPNVAHRSDIYASLRYSTDYRKGHFWTSQPWGILKRRQLTVMHVLGQFWTSQKMRNTVLMGRRQLKGVRKVVRISLTPTKQRAILKQSARRNAYTESRKHWTGRFIAKTKKWGRLGFASGIISEKGCRLTSTKRCTVRYYTVQYCTERVLRDGCYSTVLEYSTCLPPLRQFQVQSISKKTFRYVGVLLLNFIRS